MNDNRGAAGKITRDNFVDKMITWAVEEKTLENWPRFLRAWLKHRRGWNKRAIDSLVGMHVNMPLPAEYEKVIEEDFFGDCHYCSDRMSMCRAIRLHIQYLMLVSAKEAKAWERKSPDGA